LGRVLVCAPHQPARARLVELVHAGRQAASVTATGSYRAAAGPAARGEVDTVLVALHGVALSRPVFADLAVVCSAGNRRFSPPTLVVLTHQAPTSRTLEALLEVGAGGILTWPLGPAIGRVLTVRQHQLLNTLTSGDTDAAVAREFGITLGSVKTELRGLYRKLGAIGRADACAHAFRTGLLT
jgi:DNA-binding NarL/FixJ family response regulator